MKSLPARPSLESLRKQARKLVRDSAAGDAGASARVRVQLPHADLPLTQRNAQLVVAREYGYAGWLDLTAEVNRRLGDGVEWAATQARRAIHDDDSERLKQLLAEYPALLTWRGGDDQGGLLGYATDAFGDAFEPERERWFTRAASAELLIDAGAVVTSSVCEGLLQSRARGLLQLFQRKRLLPGTIRFSAALGDLDAVRAALTAPGNDLATVNEAFAIACRFKHETIAALLLDRASTLDPELGRRIADGPGRSAFLEQFMETTPLDGDRGLPQAPWESFVMRRVRRALGDGDLGTFLRELQREPWLLGEALVWFQRELIEQATLNDRADFIVALLDLAPAILRRQPPPPSQAIEFALTYAHTHLIPLLTRIWSLPDDLPHAAGTGNLARVKHWFDASGAPALGDLDDHYPGNDAHARANLQWGPPTVQQVLDTALAFAVINRHFEVAEFLLAHGADINTNWNSHEPASILHHLVFEDNYESMSFLVDHGIDLTIRDYRWNSTAHGWALFGKSDEKMAEWLADAERVRQETAR